MIASLAFVPVDSLDGALSDLSRELLRVLGWFEENYVGLPNRFGGRRIPLYPPEMWSVYQRTLMGRDRTNNFVEAAHRRMQSEFGVDHPTLWRFIDGIRKLQAGEIFSMSSSSGERSRQGGARNMSGQQNEFCERPVILLMLVALVEQRSAKDNKQPAAVEAYLDACGIAVLNGYRCEQHTLITEDGYILEIQHLSHKRYDGNDNLGEPVLLQHGLMRSSVDWIINHPNQSLGFLLADKGYDVWLGNVRGNSYGKHHIRLNPRDKGFWKFTFDEMSRYDLPAMVEHVLRFTKHSSLHYVGFSQGTLMGFICFSEKPEWAKEKIKSFHALAPVAYLGEAKTKVAILKHFMRHGNWMSVLFGMRFTSRSTFLRRLGGALCAGMLARFCKEVYLLFYDHHPASINPTRMPVYLAHITDGTATMNIAHFGQVIATGSLRKFDYGSSGNMKHYGQIDPPTYHPRRSLVPTAFYYGTDDIMTVEADVNKLICETQNKLGIFRYENVHHLDFTWGLNVVDTVYAQLMQMLSEQSIQ
uniref:Lipase n=2 Tax=Trichuris muris TaxID=70415 RepID=A0A5S6PZ58_TRIMR